MRNSGHITPADRMAKLVAAARADDDAATARPSIDRDDEVGVAGGDGPVAAVDAPAAGGDVPVRSPRALPAAARPARTGGWTPQLAPDDMQDSHGLRAWLASKLPESPRLGIAMGAGIVAVAIMLVAGGIFAIRFAVAAPAVHPIAEGTASAAPGQAASTTPGATNLASPDAPAPSAPPSAAAATRVTVQVVGAVRKPGVVRLQAGARVVDAVKAAGGPSSRADTAAVNMARKIVDGEQIRLPRIGEQPTPAQPTTPLSGNPADGSAPAVGAPDPASPGTAPAVNLNTAGDTELETLPNIGPVTAQKIIDWRTANNGFSTVEDLLDVPGIGPKTFAQLKDLVTV